VIFSDHNIISMIIHFLFGGGFLKLNFVINFLAYFYY